MRRLGKTRVLALAVLGSLGMTACGSGGGGSDKGTGSAEAFHYGVSCDQTTGFANLTAPLVHGIQAYAKKVNAAGGVKGKTIEIDATDTQSGGTDVSKYVAAIKNHISSDKVSGEFVCLSTGALAYAKQFNSQKVPVMVTQQLDVDPADRPYFFGSTPQVTAQADLGLEYLKKATGKDNPNIAIAVMDTSAGSAILSHTEEAAKKAGMTVATTVKLPLSQTDFSSVASQIDAAHVDGTLVYMTTILTPLMKALSDRGFDKPSIAVGAPPTDADLQAGAGFLAGQRSYASPTDSGNDAVNSMVADAKKYGATEVDLKGTYFTQGWLAGIMIESALKDCAGSCNGEQFKKALESLDVDTGALGGRLTMSPHDHGLQSQVRTFTWSASKNQVVPLSDFEDVTAKSYQGDVVGGAAG